MLFCQNAESPLTNLLLSLTAFKQEWLFLNVQDDNKDWKVHYINNEELVDVFVCETIIVVYVQNKTKYIANSWEK